MSTRPKKFSVQPATPPKSDINVTPLVDVVLVLLIIFMVVTPLLEKDIEVKVPTTEQVEMPTEIPQGQLLVSLDKAGVISINTETIPEADYVDRLKRMVAAKPKGDRLVFFLADDETNYAKLVTALDGAKQAGAELLGMMTEKPEAGADASGAPADPAAPASPTP